MYRIIKVNLGEKWLLDSFDELGSWDFLNKQGYFIEIEFLNKVGDEWVLCAVDSCGTVKTYYFKAVEEITLIRK